MRAHSYRSPAAASGCAPPPAPRYTCLDRQTGRAAADGASVPDCEPYFECGSAKDLITVPASYLIFSKRMLIFDMQADLFHLTDDLSPKCSTLHLSSQYSNPDGQPALEHIQRTVRCQCVIRDTGILHVERRIFRSFRRSSRQDFL